MQDDEREPTKAERRLVDIANDWLITTGYVSTLSRKLGVEPRRRESLTPTNKQPTTRDARLTTGGRLMKTTKWHARQGDVLIVETTKLPAKTEPVAREGGRVVLAHGELTGHAHAIADAKVTYVKDADGRHYFSIGDEAATLRHEEHNPIKFEPGKTFRAVRQTEYSPAALRNVAD